MIAEIISTGDELVFGEIADTNAPYLASRLSELGVSVHYHTVTGDSFSYLTDTLKAAVERSGLIICTGGLGPTKDDMTREVISEFCCVPLRLHEESFSRIKAIFRRRNLELSPTNRKQAMIPEGAEIISNKWGTAPGFSINYKKCRIIALPGVPGEMKEMFEEEVYPLLKKEREGKTVISKKFLRCFCITESSLGEKLGHLMERDRNPLVGTKAGSGIISLRILARASSEEEGKVLIDKTEKEIREILGNEVIFGEGEERPEHAVAGELAKKNFTLSVAESCTGGLISNKLTDVPGISSYYLEGITSYSNEAKVKILGVPREMIEEHGAVSPQVARAMAEGVRKLSGSDFSVSTTGIAGPGGGTPEKPVGLVYIGVAGPGGVEAHKFNFSGPREFIKERTANTALGLLRLAVMKYII